ncbi:MAG: hypothetical protein IPK78_17970 [Rhodospirillales bacterium]|nr:hypothetical protein [Rhodospirillales bacterium]
MEVLNERFAAATGGVSELHVQPRLVIGRVSAGQGKIPSWQEKASHIAARPWAPDDAFPSGNRAAAGLAYPVGLLSLRQQPSDIVPSPTDAPLPSR